MSKPKYEITVTLPDGRAVESKSTRPYVAATIGTYPDGRVWIRSYHLTSEAAMKFAGAERGRWIRGGHAPETVPTFEWTLVDRVEEIA